MSDDRANVHRWARGTHAGTRRNRYHPFQPRGLYAQSYQREQFVRMVVENGIAFDRMEILDLGCGTGSWCRYFAELKATTSGVTGVDVSPERLALARSLSPIRYVEGDMTQLPVLFDHQFDLVTAFVSLMFLRDVSEVAAVFSGVYDRLRPGGYFFVYEQSDEHDAHADSSGWPLKTLVSEGESAGFAIVAKQRFFKVLLGVLDPLELMSFRKMGWWRVAEQLLPGRWTYYGVLLRKL